MHRRWWRPHPIRIAYGPPMHFNGQSTEQILTTIDQTLREMFAQLRCGN